MKLCIFSLLFTTAALLAQNGSSAAPGKIQLLVITGQDTGSWDYITVDSAARRLYVSHETQVEVLNADTGKPVGVIPDTPGVHGIAIAAKVNRGYTSKGREDKVTMFDAENLRVLGKVDVGKARMESISTPRRTGCS